QQSVQTIGSRSGLLVFYTSISPQLNKGNIFNVTNRPEARFDGNQIHLENSQFFIHTNQPPFYPELISVPNGIAPEDWFVVSGGTPYICGNDPDPQLPVSNNLHDHLVPQAMETLASSDIPGLVWSTKYLLVGEGHKAANEILETMEPTAADVLLNLIEVEQKIQQVDVKELLLFTETKSAEQVLALNQLLALQQENASIEARADYELNQQLINQVLLEALKSSIDQAISQSADALNAVAMQCPLTGGNAVYTARTLLEISIDDDLACTPTEKRSNDQNPMASRGSVLIQPNPFLDQISLTMELEMKEISFIDLTGKLVLHQDQVHAKTIDFPVANLSPGIYFLQVVFEDGTSITEKVIKQ
ncbi:MAG: T9SS type A sorting domain-containing protein, partial [Bacteroidota bacterium]